MAEATSSRGRSRRARRKPETVQSPRHSPLVTPISNRELLELEHTSTR
jgi:hypothetical protein